MTQTAMHILPDGRRIAHHYHLGTGPTLVFLPGYMSDMHGGKATAVIDWAQAHGRACLLLDYSGCGESGGDFADGTLSGWAQDIGALIDAKGIDNVVLIGSSMGGWLMLMIAMALGDRMRGMVGIASAPDFTDWGRSDDDIRQFEAGETVFDPNPYGPEPTPMHARFWRDGQDNRLLGTVIPIDCPVRLLHGQRDADVPWDISMRLAAALRSDAVQVTLVKDGDHRLSRPQDIALLLDTIERMPA
ncbi:MAG: alpha/beta hydrolase [Pontixanthobacter sp.]